MDWQGSLEKPRDRELVEFDLSSLTWGSDCVGTVCKIVQCLDPILTTIVNGQSTIANPNDTPLTVTISSGSGTFQNPIPANSTVTVTNIVGGDGVNAAGQAIKTFCISGNC